MALAAVLGMMGSRMLRGCAVGGVRWLAVRVLRTMQLVCVAARRGVGMDEAKKR